MRRLNIHCLIILAFFFLIVSPSLLAQEESEESVRIENSDQEASSEGSEPAEAEKGWNKVVMPFSYQNIQVPRALWEHLRNSLLKEGVKEKALEDYAIVPISLKVEVFSEDKTVLKDGLNQRIIYQEGGGALDLFESLVGKGLFYIRFSPSLVDDHPFHLFYISDSPLKERGQETLGNGCHKIFDLSDKASVFLENNGMKVTSSKKHYLHLMAGTYVFFQFIEDRLYLGYIQLLDSRYPQFSCKSV